MSAQKDYAVQFVAKEKAQLVTIERDNAPLGENQVEGRTVVSLISAGTEVVGGYCADLQAAASTGYAAVLEVETIGSAVSTVSPGDIVFTTGNHRSYQRLDEERALRVPDGLPPETAVFTRMVKIPMPAFVHTGVRPPEKCMVTGLGVVGLMAAQLAQLYCYEVTACEPDAARRRVAEEHGVSNVMPAVPLSDSSLQGQVGLGLECSGHEQAALDLCDVVRTHGEVLLVGVPWVARSDLLAQKILHSIFFNYVGVHSGWEGRMSDNQDFHSGRHHFSVALDWLAAGKIEVHESLYKKVSPTDPQTVYQAILHNQLQALTAMFDWRELWSS